MSELSDIVAVGLDLKPKTLIRAYSQGVFPWPTPGLPLLWYSPEKRAILDFNQLHISRRLKSYLRQNSWHYTLNQDFKAVIEACSQRGESGTWLLPEMKSAYSELHQLGYAHSIEVWDQEKLIGGLYGVDIANVFAGESMFHRKDNASKAAVLFAVALLKKIGRRFMDIQVMSDHMKAMGAHDISRTEFQSRLAQAKENLNPLGSVEQGKKFSFEDYCKFIV